MQLYQILLPIGLLVLFSGACFMGGIALFRKKKQFGESDRVIQTPGLVVTLHVEYGGEDNDTPIYYTVYSYYYHGEYRRFTASSGSNPCKRVPGEQVTILVDENTGSAIEERDLRSSGIFGIVLIAIGIVILAIGAFIGFMFIYFYEPM